MLALLCEILIVLFLVHNPTNEHYVGRHAALIMDDNPRIRAMLKVYAVERGYMLGYQATLFDGGFGAANRALEIVREARQREIDSRLPNIQIRR